MGAMLLYMSSIYSDICQYNTVLYDIDYETLLI